MLKNKFKIITIILIILLLLTPFVKADDEISPYVSSVVSDDPEQPQPKTTDTLDNDVDAILYTTNENEVNNISETSDDESSIYDNFKDEDVYLAGNDVLVDYLIDGNLFIVANNVTINSHVTGDVFVCANNVTIGKNSYVNNNLFAACTNLDIQGVCYNVYSASESTSISGYIYKDLRATCKNLTISGVIHRDAFVSVDSISFADSNNDDVSSMNVIKGDLNYSSKQELNIPQDLVSGKINYTKTISQSHSTQDSLLTVGTLITTVLLVWLVLSWLAPKFEKNTNVIFTKKCLPILGYGLLTLLVVPIITFILMILGITVNVALLLLSVYLFVIGISLSLFVISINNFICNKLNVSKPIGIFGMLVITSAVVSVLTLIPYLEFIITLLSIIIGLGYFTTSIIPHNKSEKNEQKIDNNNQN